VIVSRVVTDLGIIPELEFDCLPLPGDSLVCWVDSESETVGLSTEIGGKVEREVAWGALRYRTGRLVPGVEPEYLPVMHNGKPWRPQPGDICRVEGDPPGPRIWKEPA
jgi:hypothetical protein